MNQTPIVLLAAMLAMNTAQAADPAARRPADEILAHACSGCHGTFGHSSSPTPSIAGKAEEEFIAAMREFKSGQRVSSIMNRIARGYTDEDFVAMGQFFKNR
ncbi:MAG: hypothetical protein PHE55_11865 [Methylococcaceae bacterium]|nr:hypothetical protein [Methylococcaceae bacterium]